ncbi:MAG: efflux RND transporter permease subunit, partial [Paracoccaceae bacterium]
MNAAIRWTATHPVAAVLSMIIVLALGVISALTIPQKTFPEFTQDTVSISVSYPGASPDEIQASVVRPIEDELTAVDGIDEITATISEGRGGVNVAFLLGQDIDEKLDEIRTEIDSIDVFPEDANDPVVTRASNASRVLEIALHGDVDERVLTEDAERLRNELMMLDGVSYVEVGNRRDYEISILVDRDSLRAYGMTIPEVAAAIRANSLELPSGSIDTATISVPIRTTGRNYTQSDFENIVIRTGSTGGRVYLRDVARVVDGFEDTDLSSTFNGEPAISVNVFRVGDEQVLGIVDTVSTYLDTVYRPGLPNGMSVTIWQNDADNLQSRLDLLSINAYIGLALVVICLALFLDFRLAAWSAVGIGVSFAAALAVMSLAGMSINMISLFGFILAIGIIVDNAIVVSENIYTLNEKGLPPQEAAVKATQRIAIPVIFSTVTTLVAFWPLLQLPGVLGKFLSDIPLVVMIVLTLSMIQALFILPRNLSNLNVSRDYKPNLVLRGLRLVRGGVDAVLRWIINHPLDVVLRFVTRRVFVPIAGAIALMILTVGLMANGYVRFTFFPSIDGNFVTASIEMTDGTAFARTEAVAAHVGRAASKAANQIQAGLPDGSAPVLIGQNTVVGRGAGGGGPFGGGAAASPSI